MNKLFSVHEGLKQEVKSLNLKNNNLKLEAEKLEKQIVELKEKNKILRLTGKDHGDGNREVKLKVNEIVREVDKCIAQLNR